MWRVKTNRPTDRPTTRIELQFVFADLENKAIICVLYAVCVANFFSQGIMKSRYDHSQDERNQWEDIVFVYSFLEEKKITHTPKLNTQFYQYSKYCNNVSLFLNVHSLNLYTEHKQ